MKNQIQIITMGNLVFHLSKSLSVKSNTVNSLIFAGINVCVFESKPCSQGLIFAVSSGLYFIKLQRRLYIG